MMCIKNETSRMLEDRFKNLQVSPTFENLFLTVCTSQHPDTALTLLGETPLARDGPQPSGSVLVFFREASRESAGIDSPIKEMQNTPIKCELPICIGH